MAKITAASLPPDVRRRAERQLTPSRLPSAVDAVTGSGAPLVAIAVGVVLIVVQPPTSWIWLVGLCAALVGTYTLGRIEGAAHPDHDARRQLRQVQNALWTILVHRDDGGAEPAPGTPESEPAAEPEEPREPRRIPRGGGLPGLRAVDAADDGTDDDGSDL